MLKEMNKTIAKFFVSIDFDLYYTKPDSPNGGLFEDGNLFVRKQLEDREGGLIKSVWYSWNLM